MKILVYDIAAEDGGGLFVLNNFIKDVACMEQEIEWVFLVSQPLQTEAKNIRIETVRWIKKSWLHRMWFEQFHLRRFLKKESPDFVISLQNMTVKHCRKPQYVYLHQSLQYCPKKFSFLKKEERSLAIRQRIICRIYRRSLKKADHLFVQTKWIQEATEKWLKIPKEKVDVVPVQIDAEKMVKAHYAFSGKPIFFYPARAEIYKNHETIVKACQVLRDRGRSDFEVIFTFSAEDSAYGKRIYAMSDGLNIRFAKEFSREDVFATYAHSVLVFPSYLETCGLPLLEAKAVGCPIIASDMPFSHEALDAYPNAQYFAYDDYEALANLMQGYLDHATTVVANVATETGAQACVALPNAMISKLREEEKKEGI